MTNITNVTFANSTVQGNFTFPYRPPNPAMWNLKAGFSLSILILGFLFNTFVTILFLIKKRTKTSFTIYQMNLLTINLLYILTCNILDFINSLYRFWWVGSGLCYLYLYGMWSISMALYQCHVLIAGTRMWAVVQPISYRSHSTVKNAIIICGISFVVAHIVTAPGLIMDGFFYHTAMARNGCLMNPATEDFKTWAFFIQIWGLACFYSSLLAYPYIWLKRKMGKKVGQKEFSSSQPRHVIAQDAAEAEGTVTDNSLPTINKPKNAKSEPKGPRRGQGFLVLSLLTLSLFLLWTPGALYTTLLRINFRLFTPDALTACITIKNMQMIVDPIIFLMVIPELKEWCNGCIKSLKRILFKD
ncbi:uncharacterized protein LOC129584183 [Paramacrobiotus metropolitanus]|uniref:uncharacterized protein LOC129584183 n=1 Tax=Paramacrobiotus metropolitanus TaxID=2943436 RepID=UPI00244607A0|nr:uncharacterized protein LOC129584183 [Paramacrobiotus metropolitanus]